MPDQELFNNEEQTTVEEVAPTITIYEQLVGEGKKYSDPEKLAQSVDHKERFIQQLQGELQGLRGELATRVSLEEFMENQEKTRNSTPSTALSHGPTDTSTVYDQELTTEPTSTSTGNNVDLVAEAEKRLDQKLDERDRASLEQQNLSYVKSEATKILGEEYPYLFSQKSKELGLDQEHLNTMAKSHPKAFLAIMLGQDYGKPESASPPVGSVNTTAQQAFSIASGGTRKKFSDWDEVRSDPKKYWSVETQQEIFKAAFAAHEAGEDFLG